MLKELLRRLRNAGQHLLSGKEIKVVEESPFLCPNCKRPAQGLCMSCRTMHGALWEERHLRAENMTYQEQLDTWLEIKIDKHGQETFEKPFIPSVVCSEED